MTETTAEMAKTAVAAAIGVEWTAGAVVESRAVNRSINAAKQCESNRRSGGHRRRRRKSDN